MAASTCAASGAATKAFHELHRTLADVAWGAHGDAPQQGRRMSILLDAVRSGFYAQKQIYSRSRLISWSHRGRFATGLRLARDVAGARTLDYGCGDGTFLGLLMNGAVSAARGGRRRAD